MSDLNKLVAAISAIGMVLGMSTPVWGADADVKTKGNIEIKAGDFSAKLGGRIHLDYVMADEDNVAADDNMFFRRARLAMSGSVGSDWKYKAQYDFAEDSLGARDLYLQYTALDNAAITIGQFKQHFSLEELTSSNNITFMERSLPNLFAVGRAVGVGYKYAAGSSTFGASAFGNDVGVSNDGDEPLNFSARYTIAPINADDRVLHFGIAYVMNNMDDAESLRLRQRPEARPSNGGFRLIDTGTIANVDNFNRYGLEFAYAIPGFAAQAEYMAGTVGRNSGNPDMDADGYYVQASFLPGGATRSYKEGAFGAPTNRSGQWELKARYSFLSLDDAGAGILGGEETNITIGATYYVNPNVRFLGEYVMADAEIGGVNEQPNFLQFRAQVSW